MKVTGFSFIKNAIKLDYPIVEAINSVLPICDEFVLAVGKSDDGTLEMIKNLNSDKIIVLETVWDDSLREGGRVLATETDKALAHIKDSDWAFYIQGDEVLHEKYLHPVQKAMFDYQNNPEIEGLLFKYLHFYGSYDYVADSRKWYRREIRVIRPKKDVFSYKDAQGFRKLPNNKLKVKLIDAYMYHYGWVKNPDQQLEKQKSFQKLWHNDSEVQKRLEKYENAKFDYSNIDSLAKFDGTHPQVIQKRIEKMNWQFEYDLSKKNYTARIWLLTQIEKLTGWRIGEYQNYEMI
ncbi:MAG: glycosyltransferase family 2 protein [Bacteroidetes bacterium]|nr:MAG: glycosyltransferase family 2 protein [Bacteroidota bacterium]